MKNFVQKGEVLTFLAPYNVTSGQGFLVGNTFAVATTDALSGAPVEGILEGVSSLTKAVGAISAFVRVYWDDTARNVTTTVGSNTLIGVCALAVLSGATTVRVRLNGSF